MRKMKILIIKNRYTLLNRKPWSMISYGVMNYKEIRRNIHPKIGYFFSLSFTRYEGV